MRIPSQEKRVTLQDIARKTGFTVNTVSRALKNKEDISAATAQKIQKAAREMGYVRNIAASSLRSGRTKTIGLILGVMSNPYYAVVVDTIHDVASRLGYTLLTLCSRDSAEQELQAVEAALSRQVDGILLFPSRGAQAALERLRAAGTPYVLMNRQLEEGQDDCVLCNEEIGGYLAAKHLIESGRRNLGFLCFFDVVYSTEQRMKGFLRACSEAGIPEGRRHVAVVAERDAVIHTLREWRSQGLDGLFAFCDMEAWNAISCLQSIGLRVPEDVAVVGFDNIQDKIAFPMPLCTVDPSINAMVDSAIGLLRRRIHGEDMPPQIIRVPAKIVCRDSCGGKGR